MRKCIFIIFGVALIYPGLLFAADPGSPDHISLDSILAKPGQSIELSLKVKADDSLLYNNKYWAGVGSFCIPLRYDQNAIKLDSVKFKGIVAKWDEKFTNPRIDTGFVSLVGIYNIGGEENPALISSDKAEEIARIYGRVNPKAKAGTYSIDLTVDPIQKELYFGSIDGVESWKPVFVPGKIVVK
jgi:hypothetical protein